MTEFKLMTTERIIPKLSRNNVRVPRRDNYVKRPVLSATIHPDLKRTLVAMTYWHERQSGN